MARILFLFLGSIIGLKYPKLLALNAVDAPSDRHNQTICLITLICFCCGVILTSPYLAIDIYGQQQRPTVNHVLVVGNACGVHRSVEKNIDHEGLVEKKSSVEGALLFDVSRGVDFIGGKCRVHLEACSGRGCVVKAARCSHDQRHGGEPAAQIPRPVVLVRHKG